MKLWWPKIKEKLSKAANGDPNSFPRLKKVNSELNPGDVFNGVELLEGWLVVNDAGPNAGIAGSRFTWDMREPEDIESDRERLALDLMTCLDDRVIELMLL